MNDKCETTMVKQPAYLGRIADTAGNWQAEQSHIAINEIRNYLVPIWFRSGKWSRRMNMSQSLGMWNIQWLFHQSKWCPRKQKNCQNFEVWNKRITGSGVSRTMSKRLLALNSWFNPLWLNFLVWPIGCWHFSINKVFSYVSFLDDFGLLAKADQEYIPFLNYYY